MKEEFRVIIEFPNYKISNLGNIMTTSGKIRKSSLSTGGYPQITLTFQGKRGCRFIHKLIAIAFIPNPNNYPIIDHIDSNPLNFSIENLRWCTLKMNSEYSWSKGDRKSPLLGKRGKLNKLSKVVFQYDKTGVYFIQEWENAILAGESLGLHPTQIRDCAAGKSATCGGYKWKFAIVKNKNFKKNLNY